MDKATSQTTIKPFERFKDLTAGLFGVSKQELDAKIAEEKAKRQAERERKRHERQEAQK